jgi:hypothetical protein
MAHQTEGVKFLDSVDGIGALLYDPGVGKTGTTLSWIDSQVAKTGEFRVLVVAPLTAADTWILQVSGFMDAPVKARMLQDNTRNILTKIAAARDWSGVPDAGIKVDHKGSLARQKAGHKVTILSMSAGALSSYCKERSEVVKVLRHVKKYAPHLIVVDESHIIKADNSNVSKVMYQLGQAVPHRIILTGTVAPNSPLDVYGQWRFLAPWTFSDQYDEPYTKDPLSMTIAQQKAIKPWPYGRFETRYGQKTGYKGKGVKPNEDFIDELHDRIAERSHNVRKEDALDLPPVTDIDVHFDLSPREAKAYREMAEDLAAELDSGELLEVPNVLAKLMKLRQIHAGFLKDTDTGEVHNIGNTLRKTVKDIVDVQLAGENRIVVFAFFKPECKLLADSFRRKGQNVELITGETKPDERLAIRRRFADVSRNTKRTILVAQQRTMSVSVNELVTAQHAIYASQSERRNDWVQSRGRLDRNGQTGSAVTFWNVFAPGLVGNIMLDRHKDKGDLEKAMLDHVRSFKR